MSTLDNPAGRLHAILSRYLELSSRDVPILTTWRNALDVDGAELPLALGRVAAILADLEVSIRRIDRPAATDIFDRHLTAWSTPIFLHGHAANQTPSAGPGLIDPDALAALNLLADYLEQSDEVQVPSAEDLTLVRTQIEEALAAIRVDTALPVQLRLLIAHRLHDIVWALDHISMGGPEEVAAAIERLIGALVFNRAPVDDSVVRRVYMAVQVAWGIFTKGPAALEALEAWSKMAPGGPPAIGQ